MKRINKTVVTVMIILGMTLAVYACGVLFIKKSAHADHNVMGNSTEGQPPIKYGQRIAIYTRVPGCGVSTDVTVIAIGFRHMLDGTLSPSAFRHFVRNYYITNPHPKLTVQQMDDVTVKLLEKCYGKRQGI